MKSIIWILFFYCLSCRTLFVSSKIKPIPFDYTAITENYFSPNHETPFPLTVQRNTSVYPSTTLDGKTLFYSANSEGSFDIYFRDLTTSTVVPVTNHPAAETKPAIHPKGKVLAFVSNEFDSEGDIFFLEMNLEKWKREALRGNRFLSKDYQFPLGKKNGFVDTDPVWTNDGKYLVFTSDRLSPGTANLVRYEYGTNKPLELLTDQGASSPFVSADGTEIVFVSYKDSKSGEIYKLEIGSRKIERLTKDQYLNFTPSLSPDGKYLFYNSIRVDSNENGILDERDNSRIIQRNLTNQKERYLSNADLNLFGAKYSTFNGGSIVFSLSLYNAINIYFIPATGSIPKKSSIEDQFDYALSYQKSKSYSYLELALSSIELFYSEDKVFPIFQAKVDLLLLEESKKRNLSSEFKRLEKYMDQKSKEEFGFPHKVLFDKFQFEKSGKVYERKLIENLEIAQKNKDSYFDIIPFVKEEIAIFHEKKKEYAKALEVYREILTNFPSYHRAGIVLQKIGNVTYKTSPEKIPGVYFEITENYSRSVATGGENFDPPIREKSQIVFIVDDIFREASKKTSVAELESYFLQDAEKISKNTILSSLKEFSKANLLFEQKRYKECNDLLETILPIKSGVELEPLGGKSIFQTWEVKQQYKNPIFLQASLLKYNTEKILGNVNDSFRNIKIFLEFYDPYLGVELNPEEVQKSFTYFENKALEYERQRELQQASFHYFFNNQTMFLVKSRKLGLEDLYRDFGVYYQRKMIDTIFSYGEKLREEQDQAILNQLNLLGKDKLDILGRLGKLSSRFEYLNKLGDLRDFQNIEVLSSKALFWTDSYFKIAVPRARPFLDLATLYGYAYYLINKYVIYEAYYNATDSMTPARKEEILENFKRGENELKWILFADPNYSDAYQLLGWLYQYIDIMKSTQVAKGKETIGEAYSDEYDRYFPSRNFETNIELYNQILSFLGPDYKNKKVLSDLNLNLANNYFLLNNYPKANEHYSIVESLEPAILSKLQFENYKQKAVFHFHYARSSLYKSDYETTISNLNQTIAIYTEKELKPLQSKGNDPEALKETKGKLAVAYALLGLTHLEKGENESAISEFESSLAFNRDSNKFDSLNLFNALGICYQRLGKFQKSHEMLSFADTEYKNAKEPETNSEESFITDLILPESKRIIGENRFPNPFPRDFKNLLTQGIRIQNYLDTEEFAKAETLISERKDFILKKGLEKNSVGEAILRKSNELESFIHWRGFGFDKALSNWNQASTFPELRKKSIYLFSLVEQNPTNKEHAKELNQFQVALSQFQTQSIQICQETKINKRKDSKQEFFQECETEFFQNTPFWLYLQGITEYYLSFASYSPQKAFLHLETALGYLEHPSITNLSFEGTLKDPLSQRDRVRLNLNLAKIYSSFENEKLAFEFISKAEDIIKVYGLYDQQFVLSLTKLQTLNHFQKYSEAKQTSDRLFSFLKERPTQILQISSSAFEQFGNAAFLAEFQKSKDSAFLALEKVHSLFLFQNFINANLEMEGEEESLEYARVQVLVKNLRRIESQFLSERDNKPRRKILDQQYAAQAVLLKKELEKYQLEFPNKKRFLELENLQLTKPTFESFSIHQIGSLFYVKQAFPKKAQYFSFETESSFLEFWNQILNERSNQNIYLILSQTFALDLKKIVSSRENVFLVPSENFEPKPQFPVRFVTNNFAKNATAVSKRKPSSAFERNIAEEKIDTYLLDTDLYSTSLPRYTSSNIFGELEKGRLNLRELISKNSRIQYLHLDQVPNPKNIKSLLEILDSKEILGVEFEKDWNALSGISETPVKLEAGISKFYEDRREALFWERLEFFQKAYDLYYTASSLINQSNPKEYELIQLDLARIKSKFFPEKNASLAYALILSNSENSNLLKKNAVIQFLSECFTRFETVDCKKELDFSNLEDASQKEISNVLDFYSAFQKNSATQVLNSYSQVLQIHQFEDPFLLHSRMFKLFVEMFLLEEAKKEVLALEKFAVREEEKEFCRYRNQELYYHKAFALGTTNIAKEILKNSTNAYALGLQRKWKEFDEKVSSPSFTKINYSDSVYDRYRLNIYLLWKDLETGRDYDPIALLPEKLSDGKSVLSKASLLNRSLLFRIIVESLAKETETEVQNLALEIIRQEKELGFLNRSIHFQIELANALLALGDLQQAKEYFSKLERPVGHNTLLEEFEWLQWKISFLENRKLEMLGSPNQLQISFRSAYVAADPAINFEFSKVWTNLKSSIANETVDYLVQKELKTFLFYLKKIALKKDSTESFLDISILEEKIFHRNAFLFGDEISGNALPEFASVTKDLLKKLPKEQQFFAVLNHGAKIYSISLANGKSVGKELGVSRKEILRLILSYWDSIETGGIEIIQREYLEDKFRKSLGIDKFKLSYLYFPFHYAYVPGLQKEDTNTYYVYHPEELLKRPTVSLSQWKSETLGFKTDVHLPFQNEFTKSIQKLEDFELALLKNISTPKLKVVQKEIYMKDSKELYFAEAPVRNLNNRDDGLFYLSGNTFGNSYTKSLLNLAAYYSVSKSLGSLGIINLSSNLEINSPYFLKAMFLKKTIPTSIRYRFTDSVSDTQNSFGYDQYWVGYRLITNSILVE